MLIHLDTHMDIHIETATDIDSVSTISALTSSTLTWEPSIFGRLTRASAQSPRSCDRDWRRLEELTSKTV